MDAYIEAGYWEEGYASGDIKPIFDGMKSVRMRFAIASDGVSDATVTAVSEKLGEDEALILFDPVFGVSHFVSKSVSTPLGMSRDIVDAYAKEILGKIFYASLSGIGISAELGDGSVEYLPLNTRFEDGVLSIFVPPEISEEGYTLKIGFPFCQSGDVDCGGPDAA